jgi:4-diphosphocytidyl-2-C-methyl-D-erythritol kinase
MSPVSLRARSAAKVNLTLDITGVRPNGYHELRSIVHTIGLWDTIELSIAKEAGDVLSCNVPELETEGNLCLKAVRLWREAAKIEFGARLKLEKQIPFGAGLGGGSGNAAAVLRLLQEVFGNPLSSDVLVQIAVRLGADVPLFLTGGAMLMEGIGERISPLPSLDGWLVLIKPPFGLGTPEVYRAWDEAGAPSRQDTARLLPLWPPDWQAAEGLIGNDLTAAARRLGFDVESWLAPLRDAGALQVSMSGSGSAVFGVFLAEAEAAVAADEIRARLAKDVQTLNGTVYLAPLTDRGVEVKPTASN